MLIKFETKSARVKGLAFHPKRSWLLAGLHNGVIQLWDYSERTLIDKFDEHKGPVRGLDFHKHQPLFVSGGDDLKIRVWNYKTRRCLFTLDAHEDYIRTTFFHHEHPWIISSSDDQSIRIWNWQSRSRIAVLTGHTHYIMCAQFHPSTELILSASVDQTLRVWDITGLKMKKSSTSMSSKDEISSGLPEILSKTDYSVESKEAHNSEINWCAFHPDPNKQLCLSTADDNYIKIWKLDSRNGLREVDTLRGHYNNVNAAIFHPRKDIVLSVSEDRSIRVWDLEKRSALNTHRKDMERFWTITAHPRENLFAAGHDTGFMLFKLERERPAFTVVKDVILFIRGRQLCRYVMKNDSDRSPKESVMTTLKPKTEMTHHYHKLHCYSYDENQTNQVLVSVRSNNIERSVYDSYKISSNTYSGDNPEPHRSQGLTALFIGPNRYAVLDKTKRIIFKVNDQERKSKTTISADEIFDAGPGRLFLKSKVNDLLAITLWDVENGIAINSVKVDAKYVVMSDNKNFVACVASNKIVICDGQLNILSTIHEQRKIKSVAWDGSGVLIYSTPVHVKYALTDGESTTIRSVQETLYVMAFRYNKVYCIDRNGVIKQIPVDSREFKFKQAIIRNDRSAILASLRELRSLTRAEISFLVKKGHPGLALKFVNDHYTRFPLALQAFDIDEALESAENINDKRCWEQLAEAAMQVGHVKAAETAYWKLKKPYKLAMLYLVCEQKDKMLEARTLAKELGDTSTEFVISLLAKDFVACTQIIRRCGHANLAYTSAVNHGLYDLAQDIRKELSEEQLAHLPPLENARNNVSWMQNSIPEIGNTAFENWPALDDEQEDYHNVLAEEVEEDEAGLDDHGDWEDDELRLSPDHQDEINEDSPLEDQEDGWVDDEQLEDLVDDDDDKETFVEARSQFTAPSPDRSLTSKWAQKSDLALYHVLAGSYQTALSLLKTQVGVINVAPLRVVMRDVVLQSRVAYRGLALLPTMYACPSSKESPNNFPLPVGGYRIEDLEKRLTECYSLFSTGKFAEAIDNFRNLLLSALFLQEYISDSDSAVALEKRATRAKEIISTCREYILAVQVWLERKNITGKDFEHHKRACELAAYFAKLELPTHRSKVLEKAFEVFLVKPKEFQKTKAAETIARRLLDYLNPDDPKKAKIIAFAEKVKSSYDAEVDEKVQLDYHHQNPYVLCASTFKPIYKGHQDVKCPLCGASYKPECLKEICKVCQVSEIGKNCAGIRFEFNDDN